MDTYTTRKGENFSLSDLTSKEREFLERARQLLDQGVDWDKFQNLYLDRKSPIWFEGGDLQGERLATTQVTRTPLYRILQDLASRLGIQQGLLREDGPASLGPDAKLEDFQVKDDRDAQGR